jgi:hypothetical protein
MKKGLFLLCALLSVCLTFAACADAGNGNGTGDGGNGNGSGNGNGGTENVFSDDHDEIALGAVDLSAPAELDSAAIAVRDAALLSIGNVTAENGVVSALPSHAEVYVNYNKATVSGSAALIKLSGTGENVQFSIVYDKYTSAVRYLTKASDNKYYALSASNEDGFFYAKDLNGYVAFANRLYTEVEFKQLRKALTADIDDGDRLTNKGTIASEPLTYRTGTADEKPLYVFELVYTHDLGASGFKYDAERTIRYITTTVSVAVLDGVIVQEQRATAYVGLEGESLDFQDASVMPGTTDYYFRWGADITVQIPAYDLGSLLSA